MKFFLSFFLYSFFFCLLFLLLCRRLKSYFCVYMKGVIRWWKKIFCLFFLTYCMWVYFCVCVYIAIRFYLLFFFCLSRHNVSLLEKMNIFDKKIVFFLIIIEYFFLKIMRKIELEICFLFLPFFVCFFSTSKCFNLISIVAVPWIEILFLKTIASLCCFFFSFLKWTIWKEINNWKRISYCLIIYSMYY